ncbi:hypothetical protein M8C21_006119 [Ambrosia artemisiifolia]|uniref:Uncharacterized protein n=1 Tax=Ambrosia artemisiifolia TaxID=4212 RepID=A0AAD5BQF6_AMBAR|nr:hypothetical protein M8C21_006119 [Ambrosia artemisiifolia]
MKQFRRRTRIYILSLLFLSVFAPILLLYESKGFIEDLTSFKSRRELLRLNIVKQEEGGGLREPILNVYKDVTFDPVVSSGSPDLGDKSDENNDITNRNEGETDAKGNNDITKRNEAYPDAEGNDVQRQEEKMMLNSGTKV